MSYYPNYNQVYNGYPQNGFNQQPINPYNYQERVNANQPQMQVMQPLQNNNFIKVVDSVDSVRVADIPMDYNIYYFAKPDGSEVYSKCWNRNGTTDVRIYKQIENSVEQSVNLANELIDRLNSLEGKIDNIEKLFVSISQPKQTVNKNKKDGE